MSLPKRVKNPSAHALVPRLGMYATDDRKCVRVRSRERGPSNQLTSTSFRVYEAIYGFYLDCDNIFMPARLILTSLSLFRFVVATLSNDLAETFSPSVLQPILTPGSRMQSLCTLHDRFSHLSTLLLRWCHVDCGRLAKRRAKSNLTERACPSPRHIGPSSTLLPNTFQADTGLPSSVLLVHLFHPNLMVPYLSLKYLCTPMAGKRPQRGTEKLRWVE